VGCGELGCGVTTGIWTDVGTVTDGMDYEVSWLEGVDDGNPGSWGAPYDVSIWGGDASGPLVRLDVAGITKGGAAEVTERSTILNAGTGQAGNDLWVMFSMTDLAEWNNCIVDNVRVIPEPASICLLGLGGLSLIRRRRA